MSLLDKFKEFEEKEKKAQERQKQEEQEQTEKAYQDKPPARQRQVKPEAKPTVVIDDHILKLVKIGARHELTEDNMIQYFKKVSKTKLYELNRYFSEDCDVDIEKILKKLFNEGKLNRDRNNWYSLKR